MKKLNIAIVGYGRSGCDIHGAFLRSKDNDICNVVAVVEYDPPVRKLPERILAAIPTPITVSCSTAPTSTLSPTPPTPTNTSLWRLTC